MADVLWVTMDVLRRVALLIQPVMPDSAASLLDVLGVPAGASRTFAAFDEELPAGTELPAPTPIFPKFEEPAEA